MKKILRRTSCFILTVFLLCSLLPARVSAGYDLPGTCQAQTDTGAACTVKTLDHDYARNTYYSLRDIAMLLKDTDKCFSLEITRNTVSMVLGNAYAPVGVENALWESGDKLDVSLRRNEFKVNGQDVFYFTFILKLPSGYYDCFIMAADLAMILDVDMAVPGEDSLEIRTQEPFFVSPSALEQAGYFYGVNGGLVGDATTGEVYYAYQAGEPYPIASTSKLMTCLLTMEALAAGQITLEQQVTVSGAAQALAASGDGVIPLEAGGQITDYTSLQEATLGSLDLEVRNSNPLLRNMPEVTGLKTGTTNKAGACLVTSLTAGDGAAAHDLVVVVLGTEDSIERGRVSGLLARYALQVFRTGMDSPEDGTAAGNLPTHAEAAVEQILRTARKH